MYDFFLSEFMIIFLEKWFSKKTTKQTTYWNQNQNSSRGHLFYVVELLWLSKVYSVHNVNSVFSAIHYDSSYTWFPLQYVLTYSVWFITHVVSISIFLPIQYDSSHTWFPLQVSEKILSSETYLTWEITCLACVDQEKYHIYLSINLI